MNYIVSGRKLQNFQAERYFQIEQIADQFENIISNKDKKV